MDARQNPLWIKGLRAAARAGVVASVLTPGLGCAPDLRGGCGAGQAGCGGGCGDVTSDPEHCGSCGHSCLGGACVDSVCQPVLLGTGPEHAFDVAVDATDAYWTSQGPEGAGDGAVSRVSLRDGGVSTPIAVAQPVPRGLAIDDVNVYWANSGDGTVMRAPKAGGDAVPFASEQSPQDIAVDGTYVYWTNFNGQVMKAPVDGSGAPIELFAGPQTPDGIGLDGAHVYWVNRTDGEVRRAPIDGPGTASALLHDGPANATDIAVDATHVYWTNFETGEVLKLSKDGSDSAPTVIAGGESSPFGVAVDSAFVYWANNGSGEVRRAPLEGGAAATIATGQSGPRRIALDEAAIYWTNHNRGELMMLAK
ncbi:hypothetical protein SOCEGT47_069230 [Sorangium cellulosum]|uniref:DUF5050 domain-containing protein n=1 Tax=Sorangium cellulosum TaxID=56 RepID=A0A4V0NEJ2_SORCE|nr:hypothetical protein [Sorangium cellulosum]AUX26362.1 hypothetical protein SOCEGT47_069230 [Sorangium cellulosum]